MIKKTAFTLLVLIASNSFSLASEQSIRFEHLSIKDGLPQNTINAMLQDNLGFLWFATQNGLARYDGYDFKVFKAKTNDPNSLSGNFINSLIQDSRGIIWLGTYGTGLSAFNPSNETFTQYRFEPSNVNSLSHDDVTVVLEDKQGLIWIGTKGGGLNRFDPLTGIFRHYRHNNTLPKSLSHDNVTSLFQDTSGMLWVGTDGGGLNLFNPTTEQFTHYRSDPAKPNSLSSDVILAITQDQQGNLWIGTDGGGLNRFNLQTQQFIRYNSDDSNLNSLSNDNVQTIAEDKQGYLWIGTNGGGLNRFNPKTEQFNHYRFDVTDRNSLSNNEVFSMLRDDQDNFWIGTFGGGVNYFNLSTQLFNHHKFKSGNTPPLGINTISSIAEDIKNNIWLGTVGSGLHRVDAVTGKSTNYRTVPDNNSLSSNMVFAVTKDMTDMLWIGTWGGGLNKFDPKTDTFAHYGYEYPNPSNLNITKILAITEDRQGMLWIGDFGGGLSKFDKSTGLFSNYKFDPQNTNSLSNNDVLVITEDSQGMLWIGTRGSLNHFNPVTEVFTHFQFEINNPASLNDNTVTDILEDSLGNIWVATSRGLNLFDKKLKNFEHFSEKDGLSNNTIYRIEEDDMGNLWLSTDYGLSRFDPKNKSFKFYNQHDGLQSNEFNTGASFRNSSGELFFGGNNGFNRFSPDKLADDLQQPALVFTDMLILNQSVPISAKPNKQDNRSGFDSSLFTLPQAIHSTKTLTLSHLENLVSFKFSALHFNNPTKNQYAYQLVGFDKDWIQTDHKHRLATYTNLPSGNYELRVKASNSDGIWNNEGLSLNIIVTPPPWLSWWAYTLYALMLICLLLVFVRIQRNKVLFERKANAQLEYEVTQRTHELQQAIAQLEEVSLTDQLTGLKNRRFLFNNIEQDIALIERKYKNIDDNIEAEKTQDADLIFFLVDLDHFKQINDIHGHSAGDAVLIQIKHILEQVFRESEYLIRWGGEEFLVVARFTARDNAAELAERLRHTVANYHFDIGQGKPYTTSCSIGFACYPFLQHDTGALTWSQVLDVADHCLYAAKKTSRNAWVGLDSTSSCDAKDLFVKVTQQTQTLIKANELSMNTSISEDNKVVW